MRYAFISFEKNERVAMDTNRGGLCDGLLTPMPGEIPFAINTHFGVKGLAASDQAVCEAMRFAFNRLNLKLEPSGAVALACLLQNKEKFKGLCCNKKKTFFSCNF